MIEAFGVQEIRVLERAALALGRPLMANAAFGVALRSRAVLRERGCALRGGRVVVLVGGGNNGGDGLFAAVHLARWGADVDVVLVSDSAHDGGLGAVRAAGVRVRRVGPGWGAQDVAQLCSGAVLVIDAITGIGSTGGLRGVAAGVVRRVAREVGGRPGGLPVVVAVDVPSGIGVVDGTIPGPVLPADLVLACGALSPGLLLPPASYLCPEVELLDIQVGAPADGVRPVVQRLQDRDVGSLFRRPSPGDDKYARGVVGVVAGTTSFPGAAVLCTAAAVVSGAGMVRFQGPQDVSRMVLAHTPEVVPAQGRVQAWVVGPGVDPEDGEQGRRIENVLADAGMGSSSHFASSGVWGTRRTDPSIVPVVVDAGALQFITEKCPPWVMLTPHAGELARLLQAWGHDVDRDTVESAPLRHARLAHNLIGATVLLKGSATVVVGRSSTFSQAEAPNWLATAGAGDVLSGLLGTLLASRSQDAVASPHLVAQIAAMGALIHGRTAQHANPGGPLTSAAVVNGLGTTIAQLLSAPAPLA